MASKTGYYILYDVNNSGKHHIYEVTQFLDENEYMRKNIPICNRNNCSIKDINTYSNPIPYEDLVTMITNIINNTGNSISICGQCMMDIILEMRDNNISLEGINFSDALEFCKNLDRK